MLPRNHPDRIRILFDDRRLVANAGLLLPATLARHLGLRELVDHHLDLGGAPGRANTGDKMLTLVASALAGGDCIDDADVLRTGGTACTLGGTVKAPSTLGTFLRSFRWGHVRQLDRVSRELLARAWQAGAGPGDGPLPLTWTPPSARPTDWLRRATPPRLYRQAGLPPAAGRRRRHRRRADVPAARGPGQHRPRRRPLPAGDGGTGALRRGQRTTHATGRQRVLSWRGIRLPQDAASPSPSASTKACTISSRRDAWTPIPYWMDGAADVAETTCTPFQAEADAAPVRLIVRRVKPTPGSQLALFAKYSYHGFITDRDGELLELEADHRRHAEIENAIRDLKYGVGLNHLPSGRFAANGAWLAVQTMAHNLARWTARIGLGERIATTKTLRRRFFSLAGRLTRSARRLTLHLPDRWPWAEKFSRALARLRAIPLPA